MAEDTTIFISISPRKGNDQDYPDFEFSNAVTGDVTAKSVCDSFLCFLIYAGAGWGSLYGPIYYYNGTPCSDKNDYLMPNGRGNKSFVVGSEGPVFIHTVVTTAPLEECCDWDYSEWEYYKEEYKQEILEISPDCRSLVYSVPLDKIDPGKCYVVIAHYSNNNVIMSDVMVR